MNIVLIGMMGCGKTTIGTYLAEAFGLKFIDTDRLIEEKYGDIDKIFSNESEEKFREYEENILKSISIKEDGVISTGGGVVKNIKNLETLRKLGKIIYLKTNADIIFSRIVGTNRPLAQNLDIDGLKKILMEREPLYENFADEVIDIEFMTLKEIAKTIEEDYKKDERTI